MRTELNEDAVFEAMRALLARGEYPSQARVRDELGSTASAQTIGRFVGEAYKRLAGDHTGDKQRLPHYVTQAATRLHREIQQQESQLAHEAIEESQAIAERYKLDLESARREHDETREQMSYLRQQFEALADEKDSLAAERDRLSDRVDDLTAAAAADQDRIGRLETRIAESRREAAQVIRAARATHRQEMSDRDRQIKQLENELAWLKSYSEEERNRLSLEIDRERQAIKAVEAREAAMARERDDARREIDETTKQWSDRYVALEQHVADAKNRAQDLKDELGTATDEIDRLQSDVREIRGDRDRLHEALEETEQSYRVACRDRDIAQALAEDRQDQLSRVDMYGPRQ